MTRLKSWAWVICVLPAFCEAQYAVLPDPTKPVNVPAKGETDDQGNDADGFPRVKIEAVFLQGESKTAVINGQTVQEGQSWKGFNLLKVHANGVVLADAEKQKEFLINNYNFLKDATDDF